MPAIRKRTKEGKRRRRMRSLAAVLLLMTLISGTLMSMDTARLPAAADEVIRMKNGRTVMYLMDEAGLRLRDDDAHMIDQLNYSFALIRDGRASGSHWRGAETVAAFLRKHPHIDGVLSVGGWGADGFSDACMTDEGRKLLAESMLELMDAHGFVGIDVDWEYPGVPGTGIVSRPEDVENWYALLGLLREGLDAREAIHGREYILSVALGAGDGHLSAIDPARLNAMVDQAVVMAYDLCGFDRITGHHAGLYPEQASRGSGAYAVNRLTEGGLHPQRILLGIPAYGRVWRQVAGEGNGLAQRAGTSGNKTIAFDEVLRLTEIGYTKRYDETAEAAWWFDGSSFVSAEDDRSIQAKCDWLIAKGLQGAAVWQYSQDQSGAMLAMMNAAMME